MEPSDWIAIAALVATVLISIAGFFFNYKTNKENIRARRADIAAEKSIEAYRELIEIIAGIDTYISETEWKPQFTGIEPEKQAELENKLLELREFLNKHRVYFPKGIYRRLFHLLLQFHKFLSRYQTSDQEEELLELWAAINEEFGNILEQIQKHIGVEVE